MGLLVAQVVTRLLKSWLFGVQAFDGTTFVVANVLLLAAAVLASWVPSRRAARVDPMVALRWE